MTEEILCPKIPRFVDATHKGCKGHGDALLDCEFEHREDRNLIGRILTNYISKDETNIIKNKRAVR